VVWIDSSAVSRHHAVIRIENGAATIEDLGSKNGTRVGKELIETVTALHDGDEIRLGTVLLVFRAFPAAGSTQTAPVPS
jgi:pSer/pThr/pTyr-binding forkhead associated (FHA) protein